MRISDWSSDVCSSDLEVIALSLSDLRRNRVALRSELADGLPPIAGDRIQLQTGRASCRDRVCQYVSISVVAVSLNKKDTELTDNPPTLECHSHLLTQ